MTADVHEVGAEVRGDRWTAGRGVVVNGTGRRQHGDHLRKVVCDHDPDPGQPLQLLGAVGRHDQAGHPGCACGECAGQDAARASDAAVEPELSHERRAAHRIDRYLIAGGQHADGDRQVQTGALLSHLSG